MLLDIFSVQFVPRLSQKGGRDVRDCGTELRVAQGEVLDRFCPKQIHVKRFAFELTLYSLWKCIGLRSIEIAGARILNCFSLCQDNKQGFSRSMLKPPVHFFLDPWRLRSLR